MFSVFLALRFLTWDVPVRARFIRVWVAVCMSIGLRLAASQPILVLDPRHPGGQTLSLSYKVSHIAENCIKHVSNHFDDLVWFDCSTFFKFRIGNKEFHTCCHSSE